MEDRPQLTSSHARTPSYAPDLGGHRAASCRVSGASDGDACTSDSITDPSSTSASTHNYGYDSIGQLTTVNDGTITSSYGATSAGSITSTTPGNALAYNSAQQLTSLTPSSGPVVSYVYDANGARTSSTVAGTESSGPNTTSYGYGPTGSLASVTLPATVTAPAATISYTSDGDGLRQSRTAGSATDNFLWATGGSLPLLLDDGAHSYIYGPSSAPVAQVTDSSGTVQYLHSDLIGSTRVLTSSGGSVAGTTRYDEYGNAVSSGTTSAIGYSGNWTDPDTGLVYLRARDYDPHTAQFTTVDPAVDTTRQPYAYVANDPILLTDPTGLDFWGDFGTNALAFGAGVLDGATFGVSSAILGAVVPGYNCLIKDNAFFKVGNVAGTILSSVAITALTAGAGGALVATGIGLRVAAREALSIAASAAKRLITTGVEKVLTRFGERAAESGAKRSGLTSLEQGATKVPQEWGPGSATSKGSGLRWEDPDNPGNGVRIDEGVPNSPWPSQQVDHVVVRTGGQVLGPDGQPIVGSIASNPQAHIPLTDWLNWTGWNAP